MGETLIFDSTVVVGMSGPVVTGGAVAARSDANKAAVGLPGRTGEPGGAAGGESKADGERRAGGESAAIRSGDMKASLSFR